MRGEHGGGTQYVALLRGINVGGRNPVPMADLRAVLEDHGYGAVATYIQSGNVLFTADAPARTLEPTIEALLLERFATPIMTVVRSHRQLRSVVTAAPPGFGARPDEDHSDVLFLRAPLTPARMLSVVELRDGVDRAWPGRGVVYFERLSARRTDSRMSRIVGTPEYRSSTIRSWSTTTKLLALLDARRSG
jgi:uncharacterized protein (DUF1697 family)